MQPEQEPTDLPICYRAHHWDEYHPAYIAGSRAAAYRRAHPDSDRESDRQNGR